MLLNRSKFYVIHRDVDRELDMRMDKVYVRDECYGNDKITGLLLCAKVSVPMSSSRSTPLFPFTGPIEIDIHGKKTDTFDKYHMELSLNHEGVSGNTAILSVVHTYIYVDDATFFCES